MNIRDRLLSRASVAVMAAFAPKTEAGAAVGSLPAFAERVDAEAGDVSDDIGGDLSAAEQATFDRMRRGEDIGGADGAEGGADDADGDGDGDGDGVDPAISDRERTAADGEGAGDAGADGAAAKRRPKTIAYGRYERERTENERKLKETQTALDAEREKRARTDERVRMLSEAFNANKTAPAAAAAVVDDDPEPDKDEDLIGHGEWKVRKLEKVVQELQTGQQQRTERETAESAEKEVMDGYLSDLETATRADPAVGEAFVHLRESRYRELGFIYAGIDVNDPEQCATLSPDDQTKLSNAIQNSFANEQRLVATEARKNGRRPSQAVMNLALARGYQRKAAGAAAEPAAGERPAAPKGKVPAVPATPRTVTDELASIREGQRTSQSLSDAGGSPGGSLDLSRLADMPDDEFEAMYNEIRSNPKASAQFDRTLGKTPL